jgi:hypothetical protein
MAVGERKLRNDLYFEYSFGRNVDEIANALHISQIWARHTLARMAKDDLYIEGAHIRAKRSKFRKARFVYISDRDRYYDHGV